MNKIILEELRKYIEEEHLEMILIYLNYVLLVSVEDRNVIYDFVMRFHPLVMELLVIIGKDKEAKEIARPKMKAALPILSGDLLSTHQEFLKILDSRIVTLEMLNNKLCEISTYLDDVFEEGFEIEVFDPFDVFCVFYGIKMLYSEEVINDHEVKKMWSSALEDNEYVDLNNVYTINHKLYRGISQQLGIVK